MNFFFFFGGGQQKQLEYHAPEKGENHLHFGFLEQFDCFNPTYNQTDMWKIHFTRSQKDLRLTFLPSKLISIYTTTLLQSMFLKMSTNTIKSCRLLSSCQKFVLPFILRVRFIISSGFFNIFILPNSVQTKTSKTQKH